MENKLIILLVIVLGAIAVAQLVRIYEISAKLRKNEEHEISNRDNNLNARMMFGFMIAFFAFFIYLMTAYGWTGRGSAASDEGVEMDWLLNLNFVIIIAVFFLTNFLLFFFTWRYVRKPGVPAFYYPHNNKLEMLWTVVPAVVLAVIIILGLQTWNRLSGPSTPEAEKIELFSKQFDWTARYAGADNTLGLYDYKLTLDNNELALLTTNTIDSSLNNMLNGSTGIRSLQKLLNNRDTVFSDSTLNVLRTDLSRKERLYRFMTQMKQNHNAKLDASAWDDIIQKDTLYLCKGQEYEIALRAKDVIHSAYFPHFRAQMNAVPGMATRLKFTPNKTTAEMRREKNDEKFNYILMCNKICGGAHYKMKMIVVVLDKPAYRKWMDGKKKATFKDQYFPVAAAPADTTAVDTTAVVTMK
ncbi:MAG: cytochrome c oxidase subunit II [Crocinitomicaceae bacterium]|nr:cytochrome c oxidase subunit II [Crocinitomicaceae bacterium]